MNELQLKPIYHQEIVIGEQKEKKHLGTYVSRIDGGKIFEYNPESGLLSQVEREETETMKIHTNKGCYYVEALNLRNAIKKLKKGILICRT